MRTKVTKLYKNMIELRDYDVENCIKKDENITVIFNDEKMELTPYELEYKKVSTSHTFKSKNGGQDYKLYGYKWLPEKDSD